MMSPGALVMGVLWIAYAIATIFKPNLILSESAEWDFDGDGQKRRRYLIHTRINLFAAALLILTAHLMSWPCIWAIFALIVVSLLLCNKLNRGTFLPWDRFT